jgi:hypothetical protein
MTACGYLAELQRSSKIKESLLNQDGRDLRRDDEASSSIIVTWQISFEYIRKERRSAADLMSLMSFFNHQGIPESVLRRYSKTASQLDDEDTAKHEFDEDFETLRAYSLLSTTADGDACEIHALVQFCTRVWLSSFGSVEQWKQKFLELMAEEFPDGNFENWTTCQRLLPHVESLIDAEPDTDDSSKAWSRILTNVAWYMSMKGSYTAASGVASRAVEARERVLGPNDSLTLMSVSNLALVLGY